MKKKATSRPAKGTSRQSTLNFPTSSEADLIAESIAVPVSSAPTERNKIAQGKKRSAAALGQHPSTTGSPEGAKEPSSSAKNRRKRTADDADKHNKAHCDSSTQSAAQTSCASMRSIPEFDVRDAVTGSELLVRILARRREVWRGRGKYVEPAPVQLEGLPAIPKHWTWASLEQISWTSSYGTSAKCSPDNSGPPVLRIPNISKGLIDLSDLKFANEAEVIESGDEVAPGDLLIIRTNGSKNLIGRAAVVRKPLERIASYASYLIRFRLLSPGVLSDWISAIWDSHFLRSWIEQRAATSAGQHNISMSVLSTMPIPLPPPAGQHRIVAEIEKQFTRLDAGVAALKRVQANLKRYRAAVLKAACEGKLVPTEAELANRGGTNFQSGAELLAAISDLEANDLNPRRAGRLWGAGHVPDLTDEERLSLPDGWVWAKVRELGFGPENAVQVGPMSMKSSDFTDAGTPVLNVGCVQWGCFVESKLDHLPAEKAAEFERYRIKGGDVLFTRSGAVGRCAVAQPHQDGWLMTFHLLRARANPQKCLPQFLRIVFEGAPHIRRQTREASVGSTRAGFNTNLLGNLAVPLPPLAEQTRIVVEVERRLSVVEELEALVSSNLQRAARLRQSILQKAFTGELA